MRPLLAFTLFICATAANADIYQCRDDSGSVMFSSSPCPDQADLVKVLRKDELQQRNSTFDGASLKRRADQRRRATTAKATAPAQEPAAERSASALPARKGDAAPLPAKKETTSKTPTPKPVSTVVLPATTATDNPAMTASKDPRPLMDEAPASPRPKITAIPVTPAPGPATLPASAAPEEAAPPRQYKALCAAYLQERQNSLDRLRQNPGAREGEYYRTRLRELDDSLTRFNCANPH